MNNKTILQEAFKQFDLLEEETFSLDGSETSIEDAKEFIDAGDALDMLDVIDPEAETEEDLEDSYIGKVILDCNVCHSKLYKDPEEVIVDDGEECVNKDEECPFCYSMDGYKVIGQVEPFVSEPVYDVTVEEKDEVETNDDKFEEEDEKETVEESLGTDISKYQKWVDFDMKRYGRVSKITADKIRKAGLSLTKDQYGEYQVIADDKDEDAINESLENIDVETTHDKIHIEAEEKEESDADMIAPLEPEMIDEIEDNQEEFQDEDIEEPQDEEVDFDVEDFDEDTFDNLGESYLKKVYENVNSFKTTSVTEKGNKWIIEGKIGFKSGKTKPTTFVFEAFSANRQGRLNFIGENKQISRGKKSFKLSGVLDNKKFFTESLNYNYRQKDSEGKSVRVYGTVNR